MKKLGGVPIDMTLAIANAPYDAEAAAKINLETVGMLCGGFPEADPGKLRAEANRCTIKSDRTPV